MRLPPSVPAGPTVPPASPEGILRDLATVLGDRASVYLRLGPDGAVFAAKASDGSATRDSIGTPAWIRMSSEDRGKAVLGWIREASEKFRKSKVPHRSEDQVVA